VLTTATVVLFGTLAGKIFGGKTLSLKFLLL
jgi:hypothetical protein